MKQFEAIWQTGFMDVWQETPDTTLGHNYTASSVRLIFHSSKGGIFPKREPCFLTWQSGIQKYDTVW